MPFIGQQPLHGAYSKLDAITASATATYNLLLDSVAYSPESANHLLVSLNGVIQAPVDSFTVNGSQIIFDSALTSSDSIDFILALGNVLDIGTPSDNTVSTAKIVNNAVTATKLADVNFAGNTNTDTTNTGNVTLDFATYQNHILTLTGAVTLVNPSTEAVGQTGVLVFIQDGTGNRTVSLGTDYETAGAAGITLSTAASTTDIVPYIVAASGRILLGAPQLAFA